MNDYVEGVAQDYAEETATDKYNDFMGQKFQPTKDPYYMELSNGKRVRRKLPAYCTKKETKAWKKLQNKSWSHDRCFCGCVWVEWGIGWAPIFSIIPVIGPILMYLIHSKLISYAQKNFDIPGDLLVKMHGNIVFDLLISLPPIIGTFFTWMNCCSTRNCAMLYNHICKASWKRYEQEKLVGLHPTLEPGVPQYAV